MTYALAEDGFQFVRSVLNPTEIDELRMILGELDVAAGHRNLMQLLPRIRTLATSPKIMGLLRENAGANPFPVRSIFFNKTAGTNWLVPWHQDLSIAVKEQWDVPGYRAWSRKNGVLHVQPPAAILESMVTVRLHLDDCDETNGALRVIPGSHRQGRIDSSHIAQHCSREKEVVCSLPAGDALLMRPLLLHASSEAQSPSHRRVIHLEYATKPLAEGLEWAEE